jgi:hypothetical protein
MCVPYCRGVVCVCTIGSANMGCKRVGRSSGSLVVWALRLHYTSHQLQAKFALHGAENLRLGRSPLQRSIWVGRLSETVAGHSDWGTEMLVLHSTDMQQLLQARCMPQCV